MIPLSSKMLEWLIAHTKSAPNPHVRDSSCAPKVAVHCRPAHLHSPPCPSPAKQGGQRHKHF